MNKKQISLILVIVLVVGLIPHDFIEVHASAKSISEEGVELIKGFEGFRSTAYKAVQSEKYYTIGYGHYGADVYPGMTVTREQAENILRKDIQKYEGYVNSFLNTYSISVNQSQYDALVSFTYNLGNVWVSTPTFLLKTYLINGINNYTDQQITIAFTNWCKDGAGNVMNGLLARRQKEANYFLREGNGKAETAPQIHAWISNEKMGNVPENYKLGEMYYLCYEVIDSSTGKRFESSSSHYSINETIYGPDGNVVNTCDYENSNNNWISHSSYTAGTYRGVIKISGDYEGCVEVSYTLNEVKPQIRVWVSKDKMGESIEKSKRDNMMYLCYEMRDKNSEKKLNEKLVANYTVTETIYKPNGSVAHTFSYKNSDYNWIGYKASELGNYKCSVVVSGYVNGSSDTEVLVIDPTIEPTKTEKPTIAPTIRPTRKPTMAPTIEPTSKPTISPTIGPTLKPTISPTIEPTSKPAISPMIDSTSKPTISPTISKPTIKPNTPTSVPSISPTITPNYGFNEKNNYIDDEKYEICEIENKEEGLKKGDEFEIKSAIYEVTGTVDVPTVELVTIEKKNIKSVSVPATVKYDGVTYKVTGIAKSAFKNNKSLTVLTIGKNVTYIGAYAFYKNNKLKKITVKSLKLQKIQKKAFLGLAKRVTLKLPASKKEVYKKMLKNAGLGK